jgi:curved DNA-binding protein CbpA
VTQERDPYLVLGIARDAPDRVVRQAYYARARRAHPDLVGTHGLEAMTLLNEAWAILKDPQRRAAYDAAHVDSPTNQTPTQQKPSATSPKSGWQGPGGQPDWTGAAGKPPGRPWGGVLQFGIYAGWSVGEVARTDRGYLVWLRDRPEGRPFAGEIDHLVDPQGGESGGPGRGTGTGRRR